MTADLFQGFGNSNRHDPTFKEPTTANASGVIILDLGDRAKTLIVDDNTQTITLLNKLIDLGKPAFKNATEEERIEAGFGIHHAAAGTDTRGHLRKKIDVQNDDGTVSDELLKLVEIASMGGAVGTDEDINLRLGIVEGGDEPILQVLVDGKWSTDILQIEGDLARQLIEAFSFVNQEPSVASAVLVEATEDAAGFTADLLEGASDPDTDDVLGVTNLVLTDGDDRGVSIDGNNLSIDPGAYNYLAAGELEVISYSYLVDDSNGGTTAQTATITIVGQNDVPTVSAAVTAVSTEDEGAFTVDLLASASDVDTSDVLNVSSLSLTFGDASGVTVNGNTLDVDPNAYNALAVGEEEVITYSYLVDDGNGGTTAQTATLTITGENDTPFAANDAVSLSEDDASVSGTVLTDADTDADTNDVLSVGNAGTFDLQFGTVILAADGTYTYTPNEAAQALNDGEQGIDTLDVVIVDGNGGEATQSLTISVIGANDGGPIVISFQDIDPSAIETSASGINFAFETQGLRFAAGSGFEFDDEGNLVIAPDFSGGFATIQLRISAVDGGDIDLLGFDLLEIDALFPQLNVEGENTGARETITDTGDIDLELLDQSAFILSVFSGSFTINNVIVDF